LAHHQDQRQASKERHERGGLEDYYGSDMAGHDCRRSIALSAFATVKTVLKSGEPLLRTKQPSTSAIYLSKARAPPTVVGFSLLSA
jgi:hypothetical protein